MKFEAARNDFGNGAITIAGSSIVVLVTVSKYDFGVGKYKLSILLDECFVLFANFHTLLSVITVDQNGGVTKRPTKD